MRSKSILFGASLFLLVAALFLMATAQRGRVETAYSPSTVVKWSSRQVLYLEWGSRVYYAVDLEPGDEVRVKFLASGRGAPSNKSGPLEPSILFFIEGHEGIVYSSPYASSFQGAFEARNGGEYRMYFQNDLEGQRTDKVVAYEVVVSSQKMVEKEKRVVEGEGCSPFAVAALTVSLACLLLERLIPVGRGVSLSRARPPAPAS